MSGNAMEEGLILQIHNPSHLDPSRFGFLAGALSGFVFVVALSILWPGVPMLLSVYLMIGVAALVGTRVTNRISGRREAVKVDALIAERDRHEAETKRKIAAMKSNAA